MPPSLELALQEFVTADTITEHPEGEPWAAMIERTRTTRAIHKVSEETFWYFLEVLPPIRQGRHCFAFAEGAEPLRLYWQQNQDDFRMRSLTWRETERFCQASGTPQQYWH